MNKNNINELSAGAEDDSNSKAQNGIVSQPNANTNVSGRLWSFVRQLPEWQLWTSSYWCPDGDGIELYISNHKSHFELTCFSGIGMSKIIIHDIEFTYLTDKIKELDFKEPFEIQCCKIADYFCRILCEYSVVVA